MAFNNIRLGTCLNKQPITAAESEQQSGHARSVCRSLRDRPIVAQVENAHNRNTYKHRRRAKIAGPLTGIIADYVLRNTTCYSVRRKCNSLAGGRHLPSQASLSN